MLNIIILEGRVNYKPSLSVTKNGKPVLKFRLGVRSNEKDAEGNYIWDNFNCTAWNNTAEFIDRCFSTGDYIAIVGESRNKEYTNKEGNKVYFNEVKVDRVSFIPSVSRKEAQSIIEDGEVIGDMPVSLGEDLGTFIDVNQDDDDDLPF